jgi:multimeric flavodoxin WrbA
MKTVAFVGCATLDSNTEMLTNEVLQIIEQAGIDTPLMQLADKNIRPCTACEVCKSGETCSLEDDLLAL